MPFTILPSKLPFWSAIITQTHGSVSAAASAVTNVSIQPATGETWYVFIDAVLHGDTAGSYVQYEQHDGTTVYPHTKHHTGGSYGDIRPHIDVLKILTNSLYCNLRVYNASSSSVTFDYGYSGFKLSQPLWSPQRIHNPEAKPWKRPASSPLPVGLEALDKYAFDILGIDPAKPNEYSLGIILEEDTVLAVDPVTNFPVERMTAIVQASVLADLIQKFKTGEVDPVKAGYRKYLDKWEAEGIVLI